MALWEKLKLIMTQVFDFLLPFISRFLTEAGQFALMAAFKYVPVIAMTMTGKDGDEKRKEVFRLIMEEAKAKGIELSTSLVNAAIEAAVAKFKKDEE